jgi:hypothetical protein
MKMEIWKTHKVYNSIQVSNLGNVRNALTFEIKKQHISDTGYYKCNAKGSNGWKTLRVNRLIADMFCENQNNLPFVDHINGIKTDNRAENLRYITQSDNLKGRFISKSKRLSTNEVIEIKRKLSEKTTTHKELANKYGTTYKNISNINIGIRHAKVNG